jgi:hypothetical protein
MNKGGRCGSAAKQHPHRPGLAPALGLRAGGEALSVIPQADHSLETLAVLLSLFRHSKWNPRGDREGRSRRSLRFVPRLETLEDRTVPSTLTVTSADDDGLAGTLRTVLAAAQSGDTIVFDPHLEGQTITLAQGQLTVGQSLDIQGLGADKLAISGHAASRVFAISAGATVTLAGLTITGGLATDGAGILNAGHLTLSNDVLSSNVAQGVAGGGLFGDGGGRGGGVANQAGATLVVVDTLFAGNQALGGPHGGNAFGGGIYNQAGTVTIDQSTFTGNQAVAGDGGSVGTAVTLPGGLSITLLGMGAGGGVWNDGGSVTITDSLLSHNRGQGGSNGDASGSTAMLPLVGSAIGGAIGSGAFFTTATPTVAIAGSTLRGNQSRGGTNVVVGAFESDAGTGRGGAVGAVAGDVSVSHSAISGNVAQGGARFRLETEFFGENLVQEGGSAGFGGGIHHQFNFGFSSPAASLTVSITDSTMSGNAAQGGGPSAFAFGGGLSTRLADVQVSNSIVSGNQAIGSPGGGFTIFFGFTFFNGGGHAVGGGINSGGGSLTISGSTVKDNLALGGPGGPSAASGGGGAGLAGGILSSDRTLVLTNSTLSGNRAIGGDATPGGIEGGSGEAGALATDPGLAGMTATISGTTFANNVAQGGNGGRFFTGSANAGGARVRFTSLQMTDCTFMGNEARGGAGGAGSGSGGAGGPGGTAFTAGLHVTEGSTATISNTSFVGNLSQGGPGGAGNPGRPGGRGGSAVGGGMANVLALTTVTNSSFVHNVVQAGAGGPGGEGANGGAGGNAQGGGIWNVLAFGFSQPFVTSLTISNSSVAHNQAVAGAGGPAGTGGIGGNGGNASGGGVFSSRTGITGQVSLTIVACSLHMNNAVGGAGTDGGNGGNALGGALLIDAGTTATLSNSAVHHNAARGGAGRNGGNGLGGGVYVASTATVSVTNSTLTHNRAEGGEGEDGGSDGQGIGGGVYNLGTFFLDAASLIDHNQASTSDDDVFGPITPI